MATKTRARVAPPTESYSPPTRDRVADPALGVLELAVAWEGEGAWAERPTPLEAARPPAQEVAGILLGLEETYRALATALGYPPHFLTLVSVTNPELKWSFEGGREAIDALRALILALPTFVANLFRPRAAGRRADLENEAEMRRLEAEAKEAETRGLRAEWEAAKIRQELALLPIQADPGAHALLWEFARQLQAADPAKLREFTAELVRYLAATHGYQARSQVALIPLP